jgi:hypothetical protein
MLLPCYYHHVLHHHFDLFLITKSLLSGGKRASRVGGVQVQVASREN